MAHFKNYRQFSLITYNYQMLKYTRGLGFCALKQKTVKKVNVYHSQGTNVYAIIRGIKATIGE